MITRGIIVIFGLIMLLVFMLCIHTRLRQFNNPPCDNTDPGVTVSRLATI